MAPLRYTAKFDPFLSLCCARVEAGGGIRFCHLATLKVDMGIFYWIMSAFRAAVIVVDFFLDLLFGVTIQHGSRDERERSEEYEHSAQVCRVGNSS